MDGAAPGAKIVVGRACWLLRRLHGRRPHRGHDRARRQPRRRHRQHVDRRPAGPQRRRQGPRRSSTPRSSTTTACSSSSPPATRARASTPSAIRRSRRRRHRRRGRRRRTTWQANYGSDVGVAAEHAAELLLPRSRARTAASSRTSSPRLGDLDDPARGWPARLSPRPATTLPPGYAMFNGTSMALAAGGRGRCPAALGCREWRHGPSDSAAAARAIYTAAEVEPGHPGVRAGQRA